MYDFMLTHANAFSMLNGNEDLFDLILIKI